MTRSILDYVAPQQVRGGMPASSNLLGQTRNHPQLLEHFQEVQFIPMFDELSVTDTPDVDAAHGDPVPGRGNTQKRASANLRARV